MLEMRVIGVYHTVQHPDYDKAMDYFRAEISPNEIVSVESPWNLDKILAEGKDHSYPQYRFLYNLCVLLQDKGVQIFPVEDMRLYKIRARLQQWYAYDGAERLESDWKYQKVSIMSSRRLLELANENGSDTLICGIFHAYDLQEMGHPKVVMLHEIPDEERQKEDRLIKKFGQHLS